MQGQLASAATSGSEQLLYPRRSLPSVVDALALGNPEAKTPR